VTFGILDTVETDIVIVLIEANVSFVEMAVIEELKGVVILIFELICVFVVKIVEVEVVVTFGILDTVETVKGIVEEG
jgi:hypothetical protein